MTEAGKADFSRMRFDRPVQRGIGSLRFLANRHGGSPRPRRRLRLY